MLDQLRLPWPEWGITKVIGRGGFGTVYEIQKDVFGKKEYAALKVLSIPESTEEIDELYSRGYDEESISAHFKECLEDIVGEYSIMVDLKGHPNIVYCDEVKYVQHDDGIGWDIFIKMELLKPLNKIATTEYNEEEVVRLGKDLCNALVYCNQQNIIHRDIKPQNIFVSKNGSYKLGDFGVAKVSDKTMSGTKIGTYEYMSPEVYRAQRYGARVDIYSLGLVMYWMMNQKCTPFLPLPPQIPTSSEKENARNRRLDGEQLPPPVNGSEKLKAIVLKACAFEAQNRYASALDMLNALNSEPTPEPVDLDIHKEMTFDHSNHPAGKHLSIQIDTKEVRFSVPMDIKDGQTIHLKGEGKYDASTGASGDLYITIHISPKPADNSNNNRIIFYIIAAIVAVVALILFMIREDQVGPPKPHEYQEEIAVQHVHSWTAATCTSPKMCSLCGETEGKPTEHIWHEATLDRAKYCVNCDAVNGSSLPYSATWCDILETSNESGSQGKDVQFGVFQDIYGSLYNNATQFWVANLPGWANTEHAVYDLSSDFERLEFSIVAGKENQEGGSSKINIYADRTLVYTSNWAGNSTSPIQGTLDVTGVEELRVECTTESGVFCYCIFDAVLYKEA